jgi:outer membrane assembly lipoprotein YfiO
MTMNGARHLLAFGLAAGLCVVSGCKKEVKKEETIETTSTSERHQRLTATILQAMNNRDYETVQRALGQFFDEYPNDKETARFKLLLADTLYEEGNYEAACEAYNSFREYYPADTHVEYALYKEAHAKFNCSNHVNCDSAPVEATLALCREYRNHGEYQKYRQHMADLERTCQKNLLDKELYVAKSYLDQNRLASARHRLNSIEETFDLSEFGKDQLGFYRLQLAKRENDTQAMAELMDDLHTMHPNSPFTAMAHRMVGSTLKA